MRFLICYISGPYQETEPKLRDTPYLFACLSTTVRISMLRRAVRTCTKGCLVAYKVCCTIVSNSWMSSSLHIMAVPYFLAVLCFDVSSEPFVLPRISSLVDFVTDPFSRRPCTSALRTPWNVSLHANAPVSRTIHDTTELSPLSNLQHQCRTIALFEAC